MKKILILISLLSIMALVTACSSTGGPNETHAQQRARLLKHSEANY